MRYFRFYLFAFGLSLCTAFAFCQGPPLNIPQGSGQPSAASKSNVVLDTSDIYYFHANNPNVIFPFSDSLLGNFEQYDPIRLNEPDYANLGNLGSAHRPLFFQPAWRRGFDVGLHQFDLYQMQAFDVSFYKITQAYTNLFYSQGPSQENALFKAQFSRNFSDGLNLSLEHRRINNAGAFDFQKAVNSDVAAGLWYHSDNGRYDGFFSFVTNSVRQQNNGGVANLELLDSTLFTPFEIGVNVETSETRHANSELAYTQYFYLNRGGGRQKSKAKNQKEEEAKQDSAVTPPLDSAGIKIPSGKPGELGKQKPNLSESQPPKAETYPPNPQSPVTPSDRVTRAGSLQSPVPLKRTFTLFHQIAWRTESFKFFDTSPDTAFYDTFLVDSRGLRFFLKHRKLENTFKLQTFKLGSRQGQAQERDLLEVGLIHAFHFIEQEPLDTRKQNDLFLTGRLHFSPGERLRIETYGHLGIGANAGDFRLNGELFLNFKKIGNLRLEAVNQLYSPSLIVQRLFVSKREFWNNDFKRTLETSLSGTYALPSFHFSVTGQYHLVSNLIYYDTSALPRQSGAFSIVQLMLRKDFHLKALHLENRLGLQKATSDILALPDFYSIHSLYLEGHIFKDVMLTRIGLDARLATAYTPPAYFPLTGQFHLQNGQSLPFTPLLDAFISFKVKTFRFFFKIENLMTRFTETFYFQTAGYPLPYGFSNGGLRLGISWRLVD